MKLTNSKIEDLVMQTGELACRIAEAVDEDNDKGLSELDYVIQEAEWVLEDYEEGFGHSLHDDLLWAKRLLKKTKDGTVIPISIETFSPLKGYEPHDIELARSILADVKATKKVLRALYKERANEQVQ